MFTSVIHSINQEIFHSILTDANVTLHVKREDSIHPIVSGNKFRKLKYNLSEAKRLGFDTILTFGGAYSNHIAATAAAAKIVGLKAIGVIRGEELGNDLAKTVLQNETLHFANNSNMRLKFISRTEYREKATTRFLEVLEKEFGKFYCIPEGGTNELAIKGCEEILGTDDSDFDIICCAVGTAGTIAGIINSSTIDQKVIGFPALKGDFLYTEIEKYVRQDNWCLEQAYHFGGYSKINVTLIEFINMFYDNHEIRLDPIYTSKMMYGLFDMISKGVFNKNTRILAIHTGGLQGIAGMNKRLDKKGLPLITV